MKKLNVFIALTLASSFAAPAAYSLPSGNYDGSLFEGDADILIGDIEFGDGDADTSDADSLEGAFRMMKRKGRRSTRRPSVTINPNSQSPLAVTSAAVNQISDTARAAALSAPGAALDAMRIPPVIAANLKVVAPGTGQLVPGWVVKNNIIRMFSLCTWSTVAVSQTQAAGATSVTVTAGADTIPAPSTRFLIPVFFLTITSSMIASQAGARLTVTWTGYNEFNVPVSSDSWQFERVNLSRPSQLSIIPYFRTKDLINPVLATVFNEVAPASGADPAVIAQFSVVVTGLATGDQVQLVIPGIDSSELRDFLRTFALKY